MNTAGRLTRPGCPPPGRMPRTWGERIPADVSGPTYHAAVLPPDPILRANRLSEGLDHQIRCCRVELCHERRLRVNGQRNSLHRT
ncbi:hypothetical protein M8818_002276 [Zalaria obscura]|uniref:Uncharacterized protein n=1 Tax=Zalaria obscura TaxID=2024903 RepID=A0ACC3SHY0_9PEZI